MVQAKLLMHYWVEGLNGSPEKVEFEVPMEPYYWPRNPRALITLLVDLPDPELECLVEQARACGWGYNSFTRTFYLLD
jgi:hypothetical protein